MLSRAFALREETRPYQARIEAITRCYDDAERAHLFDALKLVILIGISWFLEDDEGYANARRKVELLNKLGRERFLNFNKP